MAAQSKIEWCDHTWNPVVGCSPVSAGCANCYAARMAHRLGRNPVTPQYAGLTDAAGKWTGETRLAQGHLNDPLFWRKPKRIFVCSMGDLFHESVPEVFLDNVFARMIQTPRHKFVVLTKRPQQMRDYLVSETTPRRLLGVAGLKSSINPEGTPPLLWPLPNVIIMTTVENQAAADERIPPLLECGSRGWKIGVSVEPQLGPVDLTRYLWPACWRWDAKYRTPEEALAAGGYAEKKPQGLVAAGRIFIGWVIAGGENGPGARPMHPDWARTLRDQCTASGTPFFFKGWGEWMPLDPAGRCQNDDIPGGSKPKVHEWGSAAYDPISFRVGKSRSGRLLDGQEYNQFPEGM